MKSYLVGGAVRDKLLKLPVTDRDWVVVGATEGEMLAQGFLPVGKDFPVFLHPKSREEHALARTERKTAKGYGGFTVHASPQVTLEEDLRRRDLTINAMAEDEDGNLIDPFHGRDDLDNRILRHVSEAFSEDPLRVLRVARFAARYQRLGFGIAEETLDLMRQIVASGEMEHLTRERVWQEISRALGGPSPQMFFLTLRNCQALPILLPELERRFAAPRPLKSRLAPKPGAAHFLLEKRPMNDAEIPLMGFLKQAALLTEEPAIRFAAMCFDLGRESSPQEWDSCVAAQPQSLEAIGVLCKRLRAPKDYQQLALMTCRHYARCHQADRHGAAEILETLELTDAFRRPQLFQRLLAACEAIDNARRGRARRLYPQAQILRQGLALARQVEAREILDQGFRQAEIGQELRRRRISALKDWLGS